MPERARPLAVQLSTCQLGEVLICAVRYALGRKTWVPVAVAGVVRQHARALSANDRGVIARDIREWMDPRVAEDLLKQRPVYSTDDELAWLKALAALEDHHA